MQRQTQQLAQLRQFFARQYESARHYTNAVVGTGYAAFFATWGFTRAYLSPQAELLSILLVLISLASFVGWEIWRNVRNGRIFREIGKIMTDEPPQKIPGRLQQYGQRVQKRDVESFKWWWVSVMGAIIPAALALLLLGGSFVVDLISTLGPEVL